MAVNELKMLVSIWWERIPMNVYVNFVATKLPHSHFDLWDFGEVWSFYLCTVYKYYIEIEIFSGRFHFFAYNPSFCFVSQCRNGQASSRSSSDMELYQNQQSIPIQKPWDIISSRCVPDRRTMYLNSGHFRCWFNVESTLKFRWKA